MDESAILDRLDRLYQLYRHDLSEFSGQRIGTDGRYPVPDLSRYVEDDSHSAYWIMVGDALAGLVLVHWASHTYDDEGVNNLDDFFALRPYRRQGVGTRAARALFSSMPGLWQVNKKVYNTPAMGFWSRVLSDLPVEVLLEADGPEGIHVHILRSAEPI
jgi:predicted acetyltransferase